MTADRSTLPPPPETALPPTPSSPIDPSVIIRVNGCQRPSAVVRFGPYPGPRGLELQDQLAALIPDAAARE